MLFGLSGSHRSGKTTLAKRLAEDLGLHFHATSTTEVARKLGFDPVAPMSLDQRIALQVGLLRVHIEEIDKLPRPLIVDRTPADILAYTLAEIDMQSHTKVPANMLDVVETLKETAQKVLLSRYQYVYVIGQLDGYAVEPGKPAFNRAFQTHHALLVEGIMSSIARVMNYSLIRTTDFEERVSIVHESIVRELDLIETRKKSILMN